MTETIKRVLVRVNTKYCYGGESSNGRIDGFDPSDVGSNPTFPSNIHSIQEEI